MDISEVTGPFETLQFRRNPIIQDGQEGYRVYKDAKEFIRVDATNASDAFTKSGLQRAYRIERDVIRLTNVFHLSLLDGAKAAIAMKTEETAAPAAVETKQESTEPPAAALPPATEQALSDDEVNRLLQG